MMNWGQMCVCIISQYADAEEFSSTETFEMEGRKQYPHHGEVWCEGEGCYV